MTSVIDMTKLPEARDAAEATARLHDVLCIAAEATATGALETEGRMVVPAQKSKPPTKCSVSCAEPIPSSA